MMNANCNIECKEEVMDCKCREPLMEEIRALNFALVDLKLYLDTHPCECQKINIYNNFVEKYKCLVDEYQRNFGPIVAETHVSDCPWEWISNPWPWDLEMCPCSKKERMRG